MAALNFPNSPSTNDLHTENGVTFKWNGTIWKKVGSAYTDATNLNVTGISTVGSITGVAATFTGNVQIGGVLTYEDVRNIDSIGIITARNRINMPQGYHVGWLSGSTYRARIHGDSGNNFIVENGSSNVERVRINSAGKVGIGTNNPGNTVHIGGTQGVGVRWHNYTSGNSAYLTLESGDKFQSNVSGSGEHAWVSAGARKMTLTNSGRLGIGTNNPTQTLTVFDGSAVCLQSGATAFRVDQNASTWNNLSGSSPILAWDWKSGPGDLFYIGSGGNTAIADQMALVVSDGHGVKIGKSGFSNNDFDVSSTAEYFRITNNGKVGVNESSPDHMFHIKGTSANNDPILAVETSSWATGRSAAIRLSYTDGNAREIRGHYDHGLQFNLNNGEAMRIDTASRVSLGGNVANYNGGSMSSAASNLVVSAVAGANGGMSIVNSGANDIGNIFFANGTGENAIGRIQYEHQNNAFSFTTNNGERLRIHSTGIVEANSSFSSTYAATTNITPHIRVRNKAGADNIYGGIELRADRGNGAAAMFNIACLNSSTNYASTLVFQSRKTDGNFDERLRITSGGSVNIGTGERTQTARMLNVYGGAARVTQTSGGNTLELFAGTTSGQSYGLLVNAGTTSGDINSTFRNTSGTTLLRIRGDGHIGIGIDSPGSPLHAYHATTNTIAQFESGDAGAGILLKDNTHYTRLESTNGIFKIDIDAGGSLSDGEDLFLQRSGTNFFKSHHDGYQGPIPRHGTMQGTYVYRQRNQSANYEHKIRGPMSGYLDTEMDSNFVAYIKVQCIGTGTNNAYCYYRLGQDGENAGATLTHIHGNSGSNSNLPWMVLDGQHACWKTAHSTQYHYIIRVEVTGGKNQCTYTTDSDYGAN